MVRTKLAAITWIIGSFLISGCHRNPSPTQSSADLPQPTPFEQAPDPIWLQNLKNSAGGDASYRIQAIRGPQAEFSVDNGQSWKSAAVSDFIPAGTIVRTASQTSIDLFLAEHGPVFTVAPLSWARLLRINKENTGIEVISEMMIELQQGQLSGFIPKMSAASIFMIRTRKGIVEPFGHFEIGADGSVRADGGRVRANGLLYKIEPGQEFLF